MTNADETEIKPPILPPTHFLISIVVGGLLDRFLPIVQIIHWPYRWLSLIPFLAGTAIVIYLDSLFKRRGTTIKPHFEPSVLVTAGLYRYSRNPMYVGMALMLIGLAILAGSLSAYIAPVLFIVAMQLRVIPIEERLLTRSFGDEYLSYKKRVRAWL